MSFGGFESFWFVESNDFKPVVCLHTSPILLSLSSSEANFFGVKSSDF